MKIFGRKGQLAGGIGNQLIALLVIVAIAFVTIRIGSSLITNTSAGLTGEAAMASGNFSQGFWDAQQLVSLAPYLIGALIVIALVVGFGRVAGSGRM
jgi:hypothetical protein